jgi:hypothetical protein
MSENDDKRSARRVPIDRFKVVTGYRNRGYPIRELCFFAPNLTAMPDCVLNAITYIG